MNIVDKITDGLQANPQRQDFDEWVLSSEPKLSELAYYTSGTELNSLQFDNFFFHIITQSGPYKSYQRDGTLTSGSEFFLSMLSILARKLAEVGSPGLATTLVADLPTSPSKYRLEALLEFVGLDDVRTGYLDKFSRVLELLARSTSSLEDQNERELLQILIFFYNNAKHVLTVKYNLIHVFEKVKVLFLSTELRDKYPFLVHPVFDALITETDPFGLLLQTVPRNRLNPSNRVANIFSSINEEYFGHPQVSAASDQIFGYPTRTILDAVILHGRADFRTGHNHITSDEKVLLYCYFNMKMHFFTSYAVFQIIGNSLNSLFTRPNFAPLFIDLGCGPMTSGIALADMLYVLTGMPAKFTYIGIDISNAMINRARSFENSSLFPSESSFHYYSNWNDLTPKILGELSGKDTPIIFNASYLFASTSLDPVDLAQFVARFSKSYNNIYFIFQNPTLTIRNTKYYQFKDLLSFEVIKSGIEQIQYRSSKSHESHQDVFYEILKIN